MSGEIARLAYLYWQHRDPTHGSAFDDWLRAEKEVQAVGFEVARLQEELYWVDCNLFSLIQYNEDRSGLLYAQKAELRNQLATACDHRLIVAGKSIPPTRLHRVEQCMLGIHGKDSVCYHCPKCNTHIHLPK